MKRKRPKDDRPQALPPPPPRVDAPAEDADVDHTLVHSLEDADVSAAPHEADQADEADPTSCEVARPRRERQTLVPAWSPEDLAKELETAPSRATVTPPFDPASYARIVDANLAVASELRDTPRTLTAVPRSGADDADDHARIGDAESIGRAMYGSYLESDFPEALVLAERVLEHEPTHALAQLVAERCRERLAPSESPGLLKPSSVLRLKAEANEVQSLRLDPTSEVVLYHVDGFLDAATVADLAGIPRAEALDRLHALLDLGLLEVVNG